MQAIVKALNGSKKTFDVKDNIKEAGFRFGRITDGFTSKFWSIPVETAEEAKEKIQLLRSFGVEGHMDFLFDNGKCCKPRSDLTPQEHEMNKEIYFWSQTQ